jgi:hypothetical protein
VFERLTRVARPGVTGDVGLVASATLVIFAVWAANDGGYGELLWYPAAVLVLVLLVVLAWAAPGRALDMRSAVAAAALAAYTAWAYLSIFWAGDRGIALAGANRTLVYLLLFGVVLGRRWSWSHAVAYLSIWAASVVVVGVIELVRIASAAHPETSFTGGRLIVPVDYANANAALLVLGAWPLIVVSQSVPVPAPIRAIALGLAGVAAEIALLAQSKGGAIATALTVLLLVALARRRIRLLVPFVLIAGAVGLLHRPLLDVYDRVSQGDDPAGAVRSALLAIAVTFGLLVACSALIAGLERSLARLDRRQARLVSAAAGALAIAVAIAGLVAAIDRFGNPVSIASRTWHAFKYPSQTSAVSSHFVTSAGNHRYDFWRVAAHQVRSAPFNGRGVENFAVDYVRERASSEEPLYPHSLEASLLGGTGVVGFVLFGIFVAAAALICVNAARSRLPGRATAGLAVLGTAVYWFAHGSVDWLWEFPAVTGPAVAAVACLASVDATQTRTRKVPWRPVAIAVGTFAAVVALVPAWLAARQTSLGAEVWRDDAAQAYSHLDAAGRLNRLSDEPFVIAGTIAERRRNWTLASRYFARALARNKANWYSLLELAIAHAMSGERPRALGELAQAHRLDPREPIIRQVLADVRAGRSLDVGALDQAMLQRTEVPHGR